MRDENGFQIIQKRVVFWVEIGQTDATELGRWETTIESHPCVSNEAAEKLRDLWLEEGKLRVMPWGGIRPQGSYTDFRIRRAEELVDA